MSGPTPAFDQTEFAGRCDTGNEASVTWKFADGTCNDTAVNATNRDWLQLVDENFRVRFVVGETAGGAQSNFAERMRYSLNGGGFDSMNEVNLLSSVVRIFTSPEFADGDDTTQQIGGGSFIAANSAMNEGTPPASTMEPDYGGNDETEFEFCCQIVGVDVSDADTIELRVYRGTNALDVYSVTPLITVSKPGAAARARGSRQARQQARSPAGRGSFAAYRKAPRKRLFVRQTPARRGSFAA